jgi:hypothetical protein
LAREKLIARKIIPTNKRAVKNSKKAVIPGAKDGLALMGRCNG